MILQVYPPSAPLSAGSPLLSALFCVFNNLSLRHTNRLLAEVVFVKVMGQLGMIPIRVPLPGTRH